MICCVVCLGIFYQFSSIQLARHTHTSVKVKGHVTRNSDLSAWHVSLGRRKENLISCNKK